ncbi:hypothetical protein ALC56_03765 [Trachymyrmex septentrionalis]|uniref:Uncharacterized protein n=1 Tax=Trachymyrmex septentrionalis TaxID=34720 RepID=A0A195FMC5_9HYME|nr:hypothetical protein ALC56_03765 [Trachymyrmex septentrionalis]
MKNGNPRCAQTPSRRLWDGTWCAGTEVEPQKIIQSRSRNRLTELYHATESSNGRYRVFLKVAGKSFSDKVRMSTDKNPRSVLQDRFSFLVSLNSLIKLQTIERSSLPSSSTYDRLAHLKEITNTGKMLLEKADGASRHRKHAAMNSACIYVYIYSTHRARLEKRVLAADRRKTGSLSLLKIAFHVVKKFSFLTKRVVGTRIDRELAFVCPSRARDKVFLVTAGTR